MIDANEPISDRDVWASRSSPPSTVRLRPHRELLAPQRTLEQDAQGNWVARWSEHGRADHFAHAEVYCRAADEIATRTGLSVWTLGWHDED